MAVIATVKLDPSRLTEADLFDDGSVRLWAGRGMAGAEAWGLRPHEVDRLVAAFSVHGFPRRPYKGAD